jgi:hypothetical protein
LAFALGLQTKTKKRPKKKDKRIPSVMCIINDDAASNGSRCNHVMKKRKYLKKKIKNKKRRR